MRVLNGREMIFVPALRGDVAFVRAWRADEAGNLQYRLTEQNFNRAMATAADLVVAEVEEIVPVGTIPRSRYTRRGCTWTTSCRRP